MSRFRFLKKNSEDSASGTEAKLKVDEDLSSHSVHLYAMVPFNWTTVLVPV